MKRGASWTAADLVTLQLTTIGMENCVLLQRLSRPMPVQRDRQASDTVRMLSDKRDVVTHQDDRNSLRGEFTQQLAKLLLTLRIYPGGRLIQQQRSRRVHKGASEQQSSLLATRKINEGRAGVSQ